MAWAGNYPVYGVRALENGNYYCDACQAQYAPHLWWGLRARTPRDDTSGDVPVINPRQLGTQCPFCGRKPDEAAR